MVSAVSLAERRLILPVLRNLLDYEATRHSRCVQPGRSKTGDLCSLICMLVRRLSQEGAEG